MWYTSKPRQGWMAFMGCLTTTISAVALFHLSKVPLAAGKAPHKIMSVTTGTKLKSLTASLSNMEQFMKKELTPFMRVRVPGTDELLEVRNHIMTQLETKMTAKWQVELDSFDDNTPYGNKSFHNIVATLDPEAPRRLTLACHYDSKFFPTRRDGREFIGATDSAVPCAMLLDLVRVLDDKLANRKKMKDVTLQLMFFDGEEAFKEWTATDSTYGSRHLASLLGTRPHITDADKSELHMMDALVLLDLIGTKTPAPSFYDHFDNTTHLFKQLVGIEKRLRKKGLLINSKDPSYFKEKKPNSHMFVEDDHIPFLHRGVPCLHLIAIPFPEVWHTVNDDWSTLDRATIDNLLRIFRVFVVEYLHLS